MYPAITYALLVEKNACDSQVKLFQKHFGKVTPILLTNEVAAKFGSLFDIDWASRNLLTQEDLTEYQKAIVHAYAEYRNVRIPAWADYQRRYVISYEEYKKFTDHDLEEYNKVTAHALEKYKKVQALAFVEIYKRGMKAS